MSKKTSIVTMAAALFALSSQAEAASLRPCEDGATKSTQEIPNTPTMVAGEIQAHTNAGNTFNFVLERNEEGILMPQHGSHSSHSSHSSHASHASHASHHSASQ
jgi:hypothetical protein